MESYNINTTSYDLPALPENHMPRTNYIKWLHDRLSAERKVIIVKGPDGAGKSTLLKEFVRSYYNQSFSFFIGSDTWSSSSHLFLYEICDQMSKILGDRTKALEKNIGNAQLKQYFMTLYQRVAKLARQNKTNYYFVVDGLDLVNKSIGEDSIIDLLPFDPPNGLYLLASSNNEFEVPFRHEPYPIPNFSPAETEHYLSDFQITKEKISEIYSACDGMPGYLGELRHEIESGISIDDVLKNLPNGFKSLLERKWEKYTRMVSSDLSFDLLAIMCFSDIKLELSQLSQIVCVERDISISALSGCDFIKITENNNLLCFVSDAHKSFVAGKLITRKTTVETLLIKFLETRPYEKTSVQYLPELYKRANQYDSLKKLINTDYFVKTLQTEHDIDLLIKNSKLVSEIAYENNDWETLNKFSIVCSLLNTLSNKSVGEGEIDALLSMGDRQTAFNRAYLSVLPEDRLQILAKICYDLKKNGIPLPEGVISDLDNLVLQVKPTAAAKERVIEIAADLFHVNPNAASELLHKFGAKIDGKLMDIMLAFLSVKLDDEPDSANMLRSMISHESVRDFARVNSPIIAKMEPDQVITEVDETVDISAKLFLLRSWCNSNRRNSKAIKVIEFALELMTASTEYTPSMRHLRQIAEPLVVCQGENVSEAIKRIDILKNTSIVSPSDEKVRIELLLASIEVNLGIGAGVNRLYETYFALDNISDLEIRCYCLARFLISLPLIIPNDTVLMTEIENRLRSDFSELVGNSADQFNITRRMLRALTSVNPTLAREFADCLNTITNRDKAYFEILTVYIDSYSEKLDMDFIEQTIEKLSEKEKKDWAIVLILRKLAVKNSLSCISENCHLVTDIPQIPDPKDQCYAYSYIAKLFALLGNKKKYNETLESIMSAWTLIDSLWEQVELGFNILSIIGKDDPDFSHNFYNKIVDIKSGTPLADETIAEIYINTIELLIRSLPDVLKGKNYSGYLNQICESIDLIPSISSQSFLLGEIALHLFKFGKQLEAENFTKDRILKRIDSIRDLEERSQTIIKVAPVLFLYERTLLQTEIGQLSLSKRENSINRIIIYLLSKRSPEDPIDLEQLNSDIDIKTVMQVYGIMKSLKTDHEVSNAIDTIVGLMCIKEANKSNQEACNLPEKHTLTIAKELNGIIQATLPDKNNIKHEGYKLLCQANIIRLRSAATKKVKRAGSDWETVSPSARELVKQIYSISNIADRAYVMALAGSKIHYEDINLANSLLEDCKDQIYQINNIKDRADRLIALADAWKTIDDKHSSVIFLKEAFTIASMLSWDSSRDEVTGRILEMAHSIDPEVAASLTSSIDNPIVQDRYKQSLEIKELQTKPYDLNNGRSEDQIRELLRRAAYRLLRSFCSGKGYAQSEKVVCDWLKYCKDSSYEDAYNVYSWSIENNLAMNQRISLPKLEGLFENIVENLFLIRSIGETLTHVDKIRNTNSLLSSQLETDLELYYAESKIKDSMEKWIAENAGECIRIYDAYFTANDLSILKLIKPTSRVDIFTLWKTQKGMKTGDREIVSKFQSKWKEISDQRPPETHIYIIGIFSTGDGPIHDRYVISDNKGISLGTSIGGLGNKDSGVHHLQEAEVTSVEQKYINPLLLGAYRVFREEKLETLSFTL